MAHDLSFSELITRYLQASDRSPTWLARRLGLNHSTVSRWLNQQTRPADPETVVRMADILGVHAPEQRQALLAAAGYGYQEAPPAAASTTVDATGVASDAALQEPTQPPLTSPLPPPFMVPTIPPQGVVGRDEMLMQLHVLLALDHPNQANVPPAALHGMGGIGKTTLAIALAHRPTIPQVFPDGVLWVTLGPNPVIRNLLDDWGRGLGVELFAERDEEACRNRLRTLLHRRRMLLIVDDVWETSHGRMFLLGGPQCRTLITTRESPAAYALVTRARTLRVDVLQPAPALALLSSLAREAVAADEESALRLCQRLEYLPLALTLAGRLLAREADVPTRMQRLVAELIERRQARLQLLQTDRRPGTEGEQPLSLQVILGMSVERLTSVDQQRFALLSVFGGEPLTWEMAAAVYIWECAQEEAEITMSHLIQRGLVIRRGEQYWMHTLLADYAAELLADLDTP